MAGLRTVEKLSLDEGTALEAGNRIALGTEGLIIADGSVQEVSRYMDGQKTERTCPWMSALRLRLVPGSRTGLRD